MDAVAETEKETGEVLMFEKDNKGIPVFQGKLKIIMKKYGVTPETKREELLFEEVLNIK